MAIKLIHIKEHFPYFPFIFFLAYCLRIILLILFHLDFKELSLMKKSPPFITSLMSILLISFLLGACGSSSSDDDEVDTNTSPNVDAGADQTLGATYLDQYNGHTDDTRGYQYHATMRLLLKT